MQDQFDKAVLLYRRAKYKACSKACKTITFSDPNFHPAYALGAQAFVALGQIKRAEKFLRRSVELQPNIATGHLNLGIFYSQSGFNKKADKAFRTSLQIEPENPETLYAYGIYLYEKKFAKDALVCFLAACKIAPQKLESWIGLADSYRSMGELDDARGACLSALEFDSNYLPALNNYGALSTEMGDFEAAIKIFRRSSVSNPEQSQVWYNLGVCYVRAEKFDQAITVLKKGNSIAPNSTEILECLGKSYQRQKEYESAISAFRRAYEIDPEIPKLAYSLACGYLGIGAMEEASRVCKDFLSRHPGDATILSCLALISAEHGSETDNQKYNDFDRIIQTVEVATPEKFANQQLFIDALTSHILEHPTLSNGGENHATRNGLHTGNLRESDMGPVAYLERFISSSIEGYTQFLQQNSKTNFIASLRPRTWKLIIWAVAMNKQGHQVAHFHPDAWASGVFYVKLPFTTFEQQRDREGWIEFGAPTEEFLSLKQYRVKSIEPKVGSMLLFPGYLTHRTIPFSSDELRISIAFDIVPIR